MSGPKLDRRAVVAALLKDRGDMLVVPGLGQCAYDCAAAGDDPRTFYLWGAMGGAVPIGLGLAIAQPERRVMVITGDGELLMGLGSLAMVGAEAPENLAIVVLDNERYGETGQQVTHTARGTDLVQVALGTGFRDASAVDGPETLEQGIAMARTAPGPVLVGIKVSADPAPMVLPPKDGTLLKNRFRAAVLGSSSG